MQDWSSKISNAAIGDWSQHSPYDSKHPGEGFSKWCKEYWRWSHLTLDNYNLINGKRKKKNTGMWSTSCPSRPVLMHYIHMCDDSFLIIIFITLLILVRITVWQWTCQPELIKEVWSTSCVRFSGIWWWDRCDCPCWYSEADFQNTILQGTGIHCCEPYRRYTHSEHRVSSWLHCNHHAEHSTNAMLNNHHAE